MPAWVWVVAAAAVAFVLWFAWGRGWWRSVRYSWRRAAHTEQAQQVAVPWYGSMDLDAELDWRARTGFLPAPTLGQAAACPQGDAWCLKARPGQPCCLDQYRPTDWLEHTAADLSPEALAADDPGPGDDLSSLASSGPDQYPLPAVFSERHDPPPLIEFDGPWGPTRLADTGEIRDAHLLAEVAAELRAQDDDARAYCSALERDRQTYMHQLREVFA